MAAPEAAASRFAIDTDSDVIQQLRSALSRDGVRARVIDLFREWDGDGSGTVSKSEFRKALGHEPNTLTVA